MAKKATTTTKAKKTTAKAPVKTAAATATTAKVTTASREGFFTRVITPQVLVAEAVGTFMLAGAAMVAAADQPLLIGLTMALIAVAISGVSGAHGNPAVSFGRWSMGKLDLVKVPFYWVAQFIGALAAFLVVGVYSGNTKLDLSSFTSWNWNIFLLELVGTAIFLFGIAAALKLAQTTLARAAVIGLSLTVGLVVAGGFVTTAATRAQNDVQSGKITSVDSSFAAQGAALNPAVALVQTERDIAAINKQIKGEQVSQADAKKESHLTVSTVLGTLVGAAIGGNLFAVIASDAATRRRN